MDDPPNFPLSDADLLFVASALKKGLISSQQFVEACSLSLPESNDSLADTLVREGWLSNQSRQWLDSIISGRFDETTAGAPLGRAGDSTSHAASPVDDRNLDEFVLLQPEGERISLLQVHSTGGNGRVWLAHDKTLDREVALKELQPGISKITAHRERFFREARITAQLDHPGIVPVYDYVQQGDSNYYTMKFVRGSTLTERIHEYHASLDGEHQIGALLSLLNHFVSVCNSVSFAHSRRILHRDLKGANIMIGDFGEVIVLDWGIAKQMDSADVQVSSDAHSDSTVADDNPERKRHRTEVGTRLGTPAYMSPEQASGRLDAVGFSTDVYGLAAILYEILAGCPPFGGETLAEVLALVAEASPQPPGELVEGVPAELQHICLQGLSKKPADRQQAAAEIGGQVQSWIAAQADRKRSELEREKFFNLSLDLLMIVNSELQTIQINPACERILGYSVEEMMALDSSSLVYPDDAEKTATAMSRAFEGEAIVQFENRVVCKDGSIKFIHWNGKQINDANAVYVVGRDVTDRVLDSQKFHALLESAPDAMVITNESGIIELVNSQTETLFGFDRTEMLGQAIEMLMPERFRSGHPQHFQSFVTNPKPRPMGSGLQLSGQRKDGSEFPIEISLSPVVLENGLLISSAIRDVSARS